MQLLAIQCLSRRFRIVAACLIVGLAGTIATGPHATPAQDDASPQNLDDTHQASSSAGRTPKQIVFGDLHVHTTFSADAYLASLPHVGGEGAYPPADACDFARYCSRVDFWSITDHAESFTPRMWNETVKTIQACNHAAGAASNPDMVSYLGWEWTQQGNTRSDHYGHKNVVLRDFEDGKIPARPVAAGGAVKTYIAASLPKPALLERMRKAAKDDQAYVDLSTYINEVRDTPDCAAGVHVRDLPATCREYATTPADLFAKLDEWNFPALVIPHGLSWGVHASPGSSWSTQLTAALHNPKYQRLVEVYSGHGNSEQYRSFRSIAFDEQGNAFCPRPGKNYEPACWRAGKLVEARCLQKGGAASDCKTRANDARQAYVEKLRVTGFDLEHTNVQDWGLAGQCTDCFDPAYKYEPQMSAQYILAAAGKEQDPLTGKALRSRLGLIASSDNHSARGGNGFKEFGRMLNTESPTSPQGPVARALNLSMNIESERLNSFQYTGGLVAAHANGRDRNAIFDALSQREVYGTSGPRILLWFDLLNGPGNSRLPMGAETELKHAPRFEVRAIGSFEQKTGCPSDAARALGQERFTRLCRGECFNPSDTRRQITRIEVIRIRPQIDKNESLNNLVEEPWRVFQCPADRKGCVVSFEDPDFVKHRRDSIYYVRAIEEPSPAINGAGMKCLEKAGDGSCKRVSACNAANPDDDCLGPSEERAWSSPIFIDHDGE